ncbi:MAG: AAA family ATPase, partial [Thermotogae bacterium]|nr:AAA family ATPase [Thermotogota bacterium]
MKKLPLGKSDFKDIIQNNFVYVDKTKYIYDLIESGDVFFLSRPRRFGKSLTVSTLYYLFKGEKELFKNTWIYDKWNWEEWPIIRLDMSRLNGETVEANRFRLTLMLKEIAETYGVELEYSKPELYDVMIDELIKKLVRKYKKEVVVLVDEYDYPMLSNITDEEELEREREFLSKFYMMFKTNDENIRFVFITGISKFSKVSIFSKMNNLIDLTMNEEYSTMFGYVEEEIERYYREHIEVVKERLNMNEEGFWEKIREWYNGYSWDGKNKVYNPDSITRFFFEKDFQNYWFSTGTPTFL